MKRVLVFQHVPHEILGTLDPLLRENGFRIRYVNFGRHPDFRPELDGYDGLIVLGGPMNVDQEKDFPHLAVEIRLIEEALKRDMPVLGICLGAQLIAKTLGAPVTRNREKEIGWYDLTLTGHGRDDPHFSHFATTEKIFQWHGDTFAIPDSCRHLASSPLCDNQGFSYGDKVYGFQFHLEVDAPMIHRWIKLPQNKKELEELAGVSGFARVVEETERHVGRLQDLSRETFSRFLTRFGPAKTRRHLPSK